MTAAAASRGPERETSGISAARKHRWATRKAASPSTKDGFHHGIASRKSPAAENSRAAISHRRSRTMGCVSAATANSTAVNALTAGCSANWPVSSAPDGSRSAVTMRKTP